jgi:hypothetical protein
MSSTEVSKAALTPALPKRRAARREREPISCFSKPEFDRAFRSMWSELVKCLSEPEFNSSFQVDV